MDAPGRQAALLEAAARELALLPQAFEVLPGGRGGGAAGGKVQVALAEVQEARIALERAAQSWGGSGICSGGYSDALSEASAFCGAATREREDAEARWQSLRADRAGAFRRLRQLQDEQMDADKSWRDVENEGSEQERQLIAECQELEEESNSASSLLQASSVQLQQRAIIGLMFDRRKKQAERKCAENAYRSEASTEILDIQASTDAHLKDVYRRCAELEMTSAAEHRMSDERTEQLHAAWATQQERFHNQEQALEHELREFHSEYASRWEDAERSSRRKLQEKAKHASEACTDLQRRLAELDVERESEAAMRRERLEEEKQLLSEAKERAMVELQTEFRKQQQEIQARVDAERERCGRLRGQQMRKTDDLTREVTGVRASIERVRDNYRSGQARTPDLPALPAPHSATPRQRPPHPLDVLRAR